MFLSFDLLLLLVWVFLSSLLPGAILSFSVLHKSELNFLEKLLIGFALGIILLPLIPFLLYLFVGIKYSYTVALVSVGLLYLISIAFFAKNKMYDNLKIPDLSLLKEDGKNFEIQTDHLISIGLLLVLVLTYLVRIGSYGPIFMELDPYYYTYQATQLLTVGENPFNDSTSWYPELEVNHRQIPEISYLESMWYSLYTGGGEYDNMLLAAIASTYPPLVAVFAVFFVYLLVSTATKREFGLIAAGLTTFIPVFVYKLAAGEQEVQPYAFFALLFFYSMYFLSIKKKELIYPIIASFAWIALALGSSSQVVALVGVLLFTIIYSLLVFLRDEDHDTLKHILQTNLVIFVIGVLVGSTIVKSLFEIGSVYINNAVTFLIPILFTAVLYALKQKLPKQQQILALGVILVLGLVIYLSPIGVHIKDLGRSVFQIAQYNFPLDRTIAEQGEAAASFGSQMGAIAQDYSLSSTSSLFDNIAFIILVPFSIISNLILGIFVSIINLVLGTSIQYTEKTTSLLLFWFLLFIVSSVYSIWRFAKKKDDGMFIFFAAILLPPFIVGLLKAKYTIYAAVLFAIAIGVTIGQAGKEIEIEGHPLKQYAPMVVGIGLLFVVLQFAHMGLAPSLIWGSFQTLYQNDPSALTAKFAQICSATQDSEVCAAASDPLGYASLGTNYQYSQKLCLLSIFSNPSYLQDPSKAPPWEPQAAYMRCTRLASYWIESMEWIKNNLENDVRITSWWDYGHWINYFGERNAVIRNEHLSHNMIGNVAHGYVDSTPEELISIMKGYDSEYALFDMELIAGGNSLGGKYGALNYLSCAYNNETTVLKSPGESECEAEHLWETIFVSQLPCTISELTGKTGYTAYKISVGDISIPFYPSQCIGQTDQQIIDYCRAVYQATPTYCIGDATLVTGQTVPATYYINETYPNGDLKLNKAQLGLAGQLSSTAHFGQTTQVTLFYTDDMVWLDNGVIKSGYEDRKGKFYDSALYRAMFIGELPGFSLVYSSSDGAVRIFKIDDYV